MSRRRLLVALAVSLALLVAAIVLLTPWQPLGGSAPAVRPDVSRDFSPAEIDRVASFRAALGPWPYASVLVTVAVPWLVLVLLARVQGTRRARRPWLVVAATVVSVAALQWLLTLPMAVHSETVLRRVGLSTQGWPGWLRDEAVGWGMSVGITLVGLLVLFWLVRRTPRRWPWILATVAAVLTVAGSVLYPVVVEPAYNDFHPLAQGQLREQIRALAAREGYPDPQVLVSNASIRTTGENAHVSGLFGTRRVVLDDTTLAHARTDPQAVLEVIAHEFGHVRHHDVARGTVIGALAAVAAMLAFALAATGDRGRSAFAPGSDRRRDVARSAALVLALVALVPYLAAPVTNLVSRRIEAAADVHALNVTGNVPAFVRMQHDLAMTNLSDLRPAWWQTAFFATHPAPATRIATARAWARMHGQDPAAAQGTRVAKGQAR